MIPIVISVACSVVLVALSLVQLFRDRGTAEPETSAGAYWDEDCECCNAGCGETGDEDQVCLLCGH